MLGEIKKMFSCKAMRMNVKKTLSEGVAVPNALYGSGIWCMAVAEKKILNVMEDGIYFVIYQV